MSWERRASLALRGLAAAAMLVAFVVGSGTAQAATQLGQLPTLSDSPTGCGADNSTVQRTVAAGNGYIVPAGGGVITSWQHKGFDPSPGEGRLQVWSFNSGTSYTLVGRSGIEPFTAGATPTYLTRIPVSGGERLAVRTPTLTDGCTFQTALSGDVVNYNALPADPADPAPGDTHDLVNQSGNTRLNVVAAVEPDADHDGFGDESQDQCLGAAGDQSGCPPAAAAAVPTGQRARAIRKCKKKLPPGDRRKRCLKKARKLPV